MKKNALLSISSSYQIPKEIEIDEYTIDELSELIRIEAQKNLDNRME